MLEFSLTYFLNSILEEGLVGMVASIELEEFTLPVMRSIALFKVFVG
jgi:hypothetical protein